MRRRETKRGERREKERNLTIHKEEATTRRRRERGRQPQAAGPHARSRAQSAPPRSRIIGYGASVWR
jgi:hypothetical protein